MTEAGPGAEDDVRILFVCTGNVARSPYLEHSLRERLRSSGRDGFTVASAGTHPMFGHELAAPIAVALRERDAAMAPWSPQPLSLGLVSGATVILTAERGHVPAVLRLDPTAARRTFTTLQFARLLRTVPVSDVPEDSPQAAMGRLLDVAHQSRGTAGRSSADDDIVDPWRRPPRFYRRSIRSMDEALGAIADRLVALSPYSSPRSTEDPEHTA